MSYKIVFISETLETRHCAMMPYLLKSASGLIHMFHLSVQSSSRLSCAISLLNFVSYVVYLAAELNEALTQLLCCASSM